MSGPLSKIARWVTDSWWNPLTGLGTTRDKTMAGTFSAADRLTDQELSALYKDDPISRKVVNVVPREVWRQGFNLDPVDAEIQADCRALKVTSTFQDAHIWARLYGGAVILMGADDGQDVRLPLREDMVRSVSFLQVYDRRYANPATFYGDATNPRYGMPETYRLVSLTGNISVVHETRLILFGGAHTDAETKKSQVGWDSSVLQCVYDTVRAFWANNKAVEHLMTDASQGVFKIHNLMGMIAAGDIKNLQTRAILMDQCRSVARAIMIDASQGEEFTKVQTTFAGVGDVLKHTANLLSAVTEIPVTILMGQSPAGLNATGESDVRVFYDRIRSDQENEATPRLDRLIGLLASVRRRAQTPVVSFPSLWQETPKERADREKVEADTAQVLILAQVVTPERVSEDMGYEPVDQTTPEILALPGQPAVPTEGAEPDLVLNGAQIVAAIQIVQSVVAGTMPRDAGLGQLKILFNLSEKQASSLMGKAGLIPVIVPTSPGVLPNGPA